MDGNSYRSSFGIQNVFHLLYEVNIHIQGRIHTAGNRTGTVEQMDANFEVMARDLQKILSIGAEQKRLREVYEGR